MTQKYKNSVKNISHILSNGLAFAIIYSHGLRPKKFSRFITHSFSNKTQILPNPKGDSFSSSMGIFLAGKKDTVCLFTQPPGLIEWRKKHLDSEVKLLEINPRLGPSKKRGYPYGSINETLLKDDIFLSKIKNSSKQPLLITTFPDSSTREKASKIGVRIIQSADPVLVNAKSIFHQLSKRFRYLTCPSYIVQKYEDIKTAVKILSGFKFGVWVKSDGSGGDTIVYLPKLTEYSLVQAINKIRKTIMNSFDHAGLSANEKKEIIRPDSLIPNSGIIIEADVRNFGKVVVNGSNLVSTDHRGKIELLGLYSQITHKGTFCGSRNLFDDSQFKKFLLSKKISQKKIIKMLEENACHVAKTILSLNYFGIHGQDFFIVYTPKKELRIFNTEINGRISNSGVAHMAAIRAGVNHFLMLNIKSKDSHCNTLEEFKKMVTIDSIDYLNNKPQDGAIWPMAFKSIWKKVKEKYILEESSDLVRMVILADTSEVIDEIKNKLALRCDLT